MQEKKIYTAIEKIDLGDLLVIEDDTFVRKATKEDAPETIYRWIKELEFNIYKGEKIDNRFEFKSLTLEEYKNYLKDTINKMPLSDDSKDFQRGEKNTISRILNLIK